MSRTAPQSPASPAAARLAARFLKLWQVGSQPILVVGHGRSGTTWVGHVLGMSRRGLYYHEPCSPNRIGGGMDGWFRYIPPGGRDPAGLEPPLDAAFSGLPWPGRRWQHPPRTRLAPGYRIIVKEVAAMMSVEWIVQRYRPKVVAVIRHPCAVILSELAQGTSPEASVNALLNQAELFRGHLEPWRSVVVGARTPVERLAAVWAARHRVLAGAMTRHPGWVKLFYEPLCRNPQGRFRDLSHRLGLVPTREMRDYIEYSSRTSVPDPYEPVRVSRLQPDKWKQQMTAEEAQSVRRVVESFQLPFYESDEHWSL